MSSSRVARRPAPRMLSASRAQEDWKFVETGGGAVSGRPALRAGRPGNRVPRGPWAATCPSCRARPAPDAPWCRRWPAACSSPPRPASSSARSPSETCRPSVTSPCSSDWSSACPRRSLALSGADAWRQCGREGCILPGRTYRHETMSSITHRNPAGSPAMSKLATEPRTSFPTRNNLLRVHSHASRDAVEPAAGGRDRSANPVQAGALEREGSVVHRAAQTVRRDPRRGHRVRGLDRRTHRHAGWRRAWHGTRGR